MKTSSAGPGEPAERDDDAEAEIEHLRAAVRRRAAQTSLRQVAMEVGINVGTIGNFADGKVVAPHVRTMNLLRTWDLRTWAQGGEGVPVAVAERLVAAITISLPESERAGARAAVVEVVAREFEQRRVAPPAWVHALRRGASRGHVEMPEVRSDSTRERCA